MTYYVTAQYPCDDGTKQQIEYSVIADNPQEAVNALRPNLPKPHDIVRVTQPCTDWT